jgi:hypothetical protein
MYSTRHSGGAGRHPSSPAVEATDATWRAGLSAASKALAPLRLQHYPPPRPRLKINQDKQGLQKQQITAAPTSLESLGVTSYTRAAAKYQVYRPFLVIDAAARSKQYRSAAGQRRRLPDFGRNIILGRSIGAVIDASGTPADFEAMPNPDRSFRGSSGPMAQNSNVAVPEISQ